MKAVSIILPTYNRAHFLPDAFKSLSSQTFKDWELIIVDDGSIDDTDKLVVELQSKYSFLVTYIKQQNSGPAQARNEGIKLAKGKFIAFFDSDDVWESNHLSLAIDTFEIHEQLDWLYFSCRRIDLSTGDVLWPSTFYTDGLQNPLFSCVSECVGNVFFLQNDKAAICQIKEGIDSGLQNAIFRRHIFDEIMLPNFRVGEDRLFILQLLKAKFTAAFIDEVTVNYCVHDGNTSDTNLNEKNIEKRIRAMQMLIDSYESTFDYLTLTRRERNALKMRLSEDYVWKLGYSLQRENSQHTAAIKSMLTGIKYWPYRFKYWKTLLITIIKGAMSK